MATTELPLNLTVTPWSAFPTGEPEREEVLLSYVLRSIALTRESAEWKQGKRFTYADSPAVQTFTKKSDMPGREGKLSWHGRISEHGETPYESFRSGLLVDHSPNEAKYIHDIKETTKVDAIFDTVAEVWLNGYKLPIVTKDRDFAELLITIDLPAHPSPFSFEHEALVREQWSGAGAFPRATAREAPAAGADGARRSFLVISVPVTHPSAPERPEYIRGRYVSVEAVSEGADGKTAWRMSTQSDPMGSIPTFMTEMSLPSKIAQDVPSFVKWAKSLQPQT